MNPFEFVLALVTVVTVGRVIQSRYAIRDALPPGGDADQARLRDEVRLLKERVRVLERVVTDNHGSHDLDREIERLRDR